MEIKIKSLILVIVTLLPLLFSCELSRDNDEDIRQITLRHKATEIIEADQIFAFEIFREVCSLSEEENIMISPLSVSYALGMACNGAAGTTLDAFYDVLHFNNLTKAEINESYKDLTEQLIQLDEQVKFTIANSVWYKIGFDVLSEFINTCQDYFDAVVNGLNFADPASVDIINQWIEEKTNGKICGMLDYIPPDAVMYLINAVYFNAKWKYQFDKKDTQTGNFYLEDGTNYQAAFMKVNGSFNYKSCSDFSAVELPYGDSTFSMVIVLPSAGKNISDMIDKMNTDRWNECFSDLAPSGIQIELPKFKYGFKDLLNIPLVNLGLGIAFSADADFSGINPIRDLFISRVIHQTFIDVQEEGTEAAAATIVEFRESSVGPVNLRIDRPFMYLIRENSTGAILFMGKVGKPEYN